MKLYSNCVICEKWIEYWISICDNCCEIYNVSNNI